jgi:hypothetical protein
VLVGRCQYAGQQPQPVQRGEVAGGSGFLASRAVDVVEHDAGQSPARHVARLIAAVQALAAHGLQCPAINLK